MSHYVEQLEAVEDQHALFRAKFAAVNAQNALALALQYDRVPYNPKLLLGWSLDAKQRIVQLQEATARADAALLQLIRAELIKVTTHESQ